MSSLGATISFATNAQADYGPSSYSWQTGTGDVVCVGSDTVQIIGNFLADGDQNGDVGYNNAGNKYKLVSLDATADANVRIAHSDTSTASSPQPLDPTVYLRAGQYPAQRPNGSGSGLNALLNDVTETTNGGVISSYPEKVNCVRMSSEPTAANATTAQQQGWGGLHLIKAATDNLQVVALPNQTETATGNSLTNVPNTLSRNQLVYIYSTNNAIWNNIPGGYSPPNPSAPPGTTGNCGTCTVEPLVPQSGSGTRNTFLGDLTSWNASFTCCAAYVNQGAEENDPTALTTAIDPADAIVPFSGDRLKL
ncbi:MAG TPA: hypothetical protein VKY26_00285, partial [Actinomycetota bacterium]|nr:hypothetical protein [Actinomycetota bacterium]